MCVEAAAAMLSATTGPARRLYGSRIVTCLPHRDLGEGRLQWRRVIGERAYLLECHAQQNADVLGIPYGAKARIILLDLVDQAFRSGTPFVSLGLTTGAWISSMGIPLGGMTYGHVRDQVRRIAACSLQTERMSMRLPTSGQSAAELGEAHHPAAANDSNDMTPTMLRPASPRRGILDDGLFHDVMDDPICLDRVGLQQISDNSWALDLYIWLASRLPKLTERKDKAWSEIVCTVDYGYSEARKIKAKILDTLALVLAIYPQARVKVTPGGLATWPSPPAG
jgi:hypothetical protein